MKLIIIIEDTTPYPPIYLPKKYENGMWQINPTIVTYVCNLIHPVPLIKYTCKASQLLIIIYNATNDVMANGMVALFPIQIL